MDDVSSGASTSMEMGMYATKNKTDRRKGSDWIRKKKGEE